MQQQKAKKILYIISFKTLLILKLLYRLVSSLCLKFFIKTISKDSTLNQLESSHFSDFITFYLPPQTKKKIQHFVVSLFRPRSQGQEYICTESFLCRHRPSLRMSVLGCKDRKSPGQAKKVESQFKNSFNRDISISNIFTSQTRLKILLSNSENCEHLKTFRNVDCVLANWTKVQDTQANLKTTN